MNATRAAFVIAFLVIGLGMYVARSLTTPLFLSSHGNRTHVEAVAIGTATIPPKPRRMAHDGQTRHHRRVTPPTTGPIHTRTSTPMLLPTPTAKPVATFTAMPARPMRRGKRHSIKLTSRPTATPLPSPIPSSTATPGTGIITLASYWVNSARAAPGQTIGVAYVIQNQTGRTTQVSLGASIKSTRTLSWGASLSDPAHDVVAILPPGTSTHVRYFHLPRALRPGAYDVAWGLRNADSGSRIALAEASTALKIAR